MTAVNLVWITPNADQLIADMARVSSPANVGKEPNRLVRYLITHKHWSPFEMASACVEVYTSMDIGEQMLRHRSFAFQKFSFRYSDARDLNQQPALTVARVPAATNRQSSSGVADDQTQAAWHALQAHAFEQAQVAYTAALDCGVPREQARRLLPLATPTRLYMAGSLRSWLHYLELRCAEDTQQEHRDVANAIRDVLRPLAPITFEAMGL